jgi:predicted dehydrogenase
MEPAAAKELVDLAKKRNVYLASAPCSMLGETAQTIWKVLREGVIGKIRLVYANFDDGMIGPKTSPWIWRNEAGVPWPAKDEFEVGCTFEHAGYFLTWLAAFFGPAQYVTSFASCQIPDKGISVERMAPDFSVGCIEYADNIVARVTCSIVAPLDKSLTIIGDDGVIFTGNLRDDLSPVYIRRTAVGRLDGTIDRCLNPCRRWLEAALNAIPWSGKEWRMQRKYTFIRRPPRTFASKAKQVDFCRGPAEMVDAIRGKRPTRMSAELGLHITELVEALQYPERSGCKRKIESSFAAIQPLP